MPRQRIRLRLAISPQEYLSFYEGRARFVFTFSEDGRSIRFPAGVLRPFVTREGVRGVFEMELDENNRFIALHRVGAR